MNNATATFNHCLQFPEEPRRIYVMRKDAMREKMGTRFIGKNLPLAFKLMKMLRTFRYIIDILFSQQSYNYIYYCRTLRK